MPGPDNRRRSRWAKILSSRSGKPLAGRLISSPEGDFAMPNKRFAECQSVYALKQAESGPPFKEVCRKVGVVEA